MATPNEALARRWFDEVWNNDNEAAIDEMMVPDVVAHGLGPSFTGRDNFHVFYRQFRESFASVRVTLDRVIDAGDECAFRGHAEATTKNGERYTFDGAGFIRVQDGRIVEGWNFWDFLDLAIQTRAVPSTAMEDALRSAAGVQDHQEG